MIKKLFHMVNFTIIDANMMCHKGGVKHVCCENGGIGPLCCNWTKSGCENNSLNSNINCTCNSTPYNCNNYWSAKTTFGGIADP